MNIGTKSCIYIIGKKGVNDEKRVFALEFV